MRLPISQCTRSQHFLCKLVPNTLQTQKNMKHFFWKHILKGLLKASLSGLKPERPWKAPERPPFRCLKDPLSDALSATLSGKTAKNPHFQVFAHPNSQHTGANQQFGQKAFAPEASRIKWYTFSIKLENFFSASKKPERPPLRTHSFQLHLPPWGTISPSRGRPVTADRKSVV